MKNKIKWLAAFIALSVVMVFTCVIFGALNGIEQEGAGAVAATGDDEPIAVVIDPGHGGEDGGCIGTDGTLEKELNLSVAIKVCDILNSCGINAALTRDSDTALYDLYGDLHDYTNVKKTYDLKNRVRFAKESDCKLFVSIHMNKFPQSSTEGLQVYYSPNDSDSITAALRIQEYVKNYIQPQNDREIKRGGSNIYVLHRSQMAAVLVECGFLSNSDELELLKTEDYQKKLALCIAAAISDSLANFQT